MDFDLTQSDKNFLLNKAIYPEELREKTKDFNTLKGYIYIISKKFRAFPSDPERVLMKIGFSDFFTDDRRDKKEGDKDRKDLSRLRGFRTTLISFKLWRLIMFDERDTELVKGSAHEVEKELQKMVVDKYDPPSVRITFDNEPMKGYNDRPTEWFWVKGGEKGLIKILEWIDKQLYYNTQFEPAWVTRFHGNPEPKNPNMSSINPDEEFPDRPPKITSFIVTRGKVKERNELSRITKAVEGKRITQRQTTEDKKETDKQLEQRKKEIRAEHKKIEKSVSFWSDKLKGKKFTDRNMGKRVLDNGDEVKDDGKYPHYFIHKVSRPTQRIKGAPAGVTLVHYKPDVTKRQRMKMTPEEIEFRTDYMMLHEFMDLKDMKDIKTKYKKEYDHMVKKFRYGEVDLDLLDS